MKNFALGLFILLVITSCQTVQLTSIEVKKPAQITLRPSVRNITIVNNAGIQPSDIGHKNVRYKDEEKVEVSSDSLNIILTEALTQFLNEENYFNNVTFYNQPLKPGEYFLSETMVDSTLISKICKETNSDAILSLDRLIMQSTLRSENIGNSLTSHILGVEMDARFRIYSDEGILISSPVIIKDSLFWEDIGQADYYVKKQIPLRTEALRESALYIAEKMVYTLIPSWETQQRWYYANNTKKMKNAAEKFVKNEWKEAALIWGELYENEEKDSQKAKLAVNIALANEMLDDVENALNWINIAYELMLKEDDGEKSEDLIATYVYKKELEQRMRDTIQLNVQERE